MFERFKVIHFVGIGGIGMSGIAEVLYNMDYVVTGSDVRESDTVERLRGLGIKVNIGHRAENIGDADVVVISSAVSDDNAEVMEAKKRAIPVIRRAEMLAELGRLKYSTLVSGSHGKTTTTSLISTILGHAGFDPTVVIGGKLKALGTNAKLGRGRFMVAEADESDGSFLRLNPTLAVITNIDKEHMDYFRTMRSLKKAFLEFMNKAPFYGACILCIDDRNIRELVPLVERKVITYGFSEDADLRAGEVLNQGMSMSFNVLHFGEELGRFKVSLTGHHNVLNSLAAIAVALELRIDPDKIKEALSGFEGIQRRLELKGSAGGVSVYDDYGHHPTEIRATLKALSESMEGGRLTVIFQPHRYTRTKKLMNEFASSFNHADSVFLMDIYPAGEKPIKGVSASKLYKKIKEKHGNVVYEGDRAALSKRVCAGLEKSDVLLTLGAGDVWKISGEILRILKSDGKGTGTD